MKQKCSWNVHKLEESNPESKKVSQKPIQEKLKIIITSEMVISSV